MDLLEKIHFNRIIHQVMAQLHHPLLSHHEIQNLQASLNSLIEVCPNKQINEQARTLLQQTALKSTALYYAEESKHLNTFLGIVMIPIDLVELLTQNDGIGWGILSKNNNLWQIMLKYSKNIEHSIWVEHLTELTTWLDSQMEIAHQHNASNIVFGSSTPSTQTKTRTSLKTELPDFDAITKKTSTNPNTIELESFSIQNSQKGVNPFDAMRAELDRQQSQNPSSEGTAQIAKTHSGNQPDFNIEPTLKLTTTIGSTAIEQIPTNTTQKTTNAPYISNDLLKQTTQQAVAQLIPEQQVALTPEMIEQITNALAEKLKAQTVTVTAEQSSLLQTLKNEPTLPKPIELPKTIEHTQTQQTSALNDNIMVDFSSFTVPSLTDDRQNNTEHQTVDAVETWNCEFELGQDLSIAYFNIKIKQDLGFIYLVTLNTNMAKIQHQPIYISEIISNQNQFKYYLLILGSESSNQAIHFIHQFTQHHRDTFSHVSQITWQEFKKYVFDLTQCCQLYHTAPIVMKSHSLYSHIVESLISKQQMLYIEEMTADNTTPLLLLQENSRFRVIHGRNRLDMGASLEMYPCIILSRNSGITWQMIREQLKFLPQPVNVYQLFEALQHATHLE